VGRDCSPAAFSKLKVSGLYAVRSLDDHAVGIAAAGLAAGQDGRIAALDLASLGIGADELDGPSQSRCHERGWAQQRGVAIFLQYTIPETRDDGARRLDSIRDAFEAQSALAGGQVHRARLAHEGKSLEPVEIDRARCSIGRAIHSHRERRWRAGRHVGGRGLG
jgi:hypothetical protein